MRHSSLVCVALLLVTLHPAAGLAAFTSVSCLVKKVQLSGALRECLATLAVKQLEGKPLPIGNACTTKFEEKRAKLNAQAAASGVACRFIANGDGTVTDVDTGLQWEQKNGSDGVADSSNPHDVDNTYLWSAPSDGTFSRSGSAFTDFLSQLNDSRAADGSAGVGICFAAHCDWRLPTVDELQTILVHRFPCGMALCIDPIFGPTLPLDYWSTTTINAFPDNAWAVSFDSGEVVGPDLGKPSGARVRAVRGGWCGLLVEGASGSFDELNCGIP